VSKRAGEAEARRRSSLAALPAAGGGAAAAAARLLLTLNPGPEAHPDRRPVSDCPAAYSPPGPCSRVHLVAIVYGSSNFAGTLRVLEGA
jgi:hypothetical protein